MSILEIPTPRVFQPLLAPSRYKGAHGGRGSGKSHFFAESLVEQSVLRPGLRSVCIREVQKSLEQSVKRLIEDKIVALGVGTKFDVLDKEIRTPGDGLIIFQGMQNHTAESIKSLEGYDVAWVEEAQSMSRHSLRLLRPTMRKAGSELWFSWNPSSPDDPVDELLRGKDKIQGAAVVQANWRDNPWFPDVLEEERRQDEIRNPDEYEHIWNGDYVTISEAIIFHKRVSVEPFETPNDARFFFGADFGFAVDPSTLIRSWLRADVLYIDYEAYAVGVELDDMPAFYDKVPLVRKWPIKADGSRPETISHLRSKGFQISAAKKWPGSVEDGIAHLKGLKRIVVHPRCVHTASEFRKYSYKFDKKSEVILPVVVDAHNHCIDAIRYGLDGYIGGRGPIIFSPEQLQMAGRR